ncbi:MAG: hypothetical protein KJO42_17010 [Silicimonas sp.]|nr:hypothetical protein [Silicimonas sp.]NND43391.1 hypothetical protein [Silicimonas sp.]NNL74277.1 hypothetical protein [Silicimonas sp.]
MKKNAIPTAFLVAALSLSGAAIATAQNAPQPGVSADSAATQTDDARVIQAQFRGDGEGRDRDGRGRDGRHGNRGQMLGAFGPAGAAGLFEAADADGNGALTQDEIDAYLVSQIGNADTDGDDSLALQEFAPIFYAQMEPRMVDAFQALDADGSGEITTEEVEERFGSLVERLDRDDDGTLTMEDRGGRDRN